MNFFITSTIINIKKIISQKIVILLVFILPIVIFFYSNSENNEIFNLNVGIFLYEHENEIINMFKDESDVVTFIIYSDIYKMNDDVFTNTINHGYIITDLNLPFEEINIEVILSPRSIAVPIVNEIVSTNIIDYTLEQNTINILQYNFEDENIPTFVEQQIHFFRNQDIFVLPNLQEENVQITRDLQNTINIRISNGIIGITITIMLIFLLQIFIKEKKESIFQSLKYHKIQNIYYFSVFVSIAIILYITGLFAMLLTPFFSVTNISLLFIFVLLNVIISAISFFLIKQINFIQNFGIFIILLNLFFGGFFINLNEFNNQIGFLQNFFPMFWYIESMIYFN
ncbi:MAG: hypothetical protein FWF57_08020 [Defluviitaleaceae bacterium]|nr:hypothetical protein [Defluviitaleaceae bacterium]